MINESFANDCCCEDISKIENGSPVFDIFDKCYVKSNIRKFLYGNTTPNRTDYKTKEEFEKKFLEFIKETIV